MDVAEGDEGMGWIKRCFPFRVGPASCVEWKTKIRQKKSRRVHEPIHEKTSPSFMFFEHYVYSQRQIKMADAGECQSVQVSHNYTATRCTKLRASSKAKYCVGIQFLWCTPTWNTHVFRLHQGFFIHRRPSPQRQMLTPPLLPHLHYRVT